MGALNPFPNVFVCVSNLKPEEKSKFDGIFESLAPVNGLLSGEKVKPVLINSKLPLDVLGKVCNVFFPISYNFFSRSRFTVHIWLRITDNVFLSIWEMESFFLTVH